MSARVRFSQRSRRGGAGSVAQRPGAETSSQASARGGGGSLTRVASLNAFAGYLDFAARTVVGLAIVPLLLSGLGATGYGIWQVLRRLMVYMSAADGKPTQALKWVIANSAASDDYAEKRRAIGSAAVVWLCFTPLILVAGAGMAWYAPHYAHAPRELFLPMRVAILFLVMNILLAGAVGLPEAVLRGMNLDYKRMGVGATLVVLGGGLTALAVYAGWGLVGIAAAEVVTTIATAILFWRVALRALPWLGIALPSKAEVRRFFSFSGWVLGGSFILRVLQASDVVVLAGVLTAASVTGYTLTNYATQLALTLVTIPVAAITPGLGRFFGSGDYAKASAARAQMFAGAWLLATVAGALILLWNRSFVQLWVGDAHFAGAGVTMCMVVLMLQTVFIQSDSRLIDLTLNVRAKTVIAAAAAAIAIGLSVLLTARFGLIGLCAGFIAGRAVMSVSYPWIIGRVLGVQMRVQVIHALRPLAATVILLLAAYGAGTSVQATDWLGFGLGIGVTAPAAVLLAIFMGLSTDSRKQLRNRVTVLLRERKHRSQPLP